MTEIELELTYLAKEIPTEIYKTTPVNLVDIYMPDTANHPILRLRKKGNTYEITKKFPVDGADSSRQYEHTITLTEAEYTALSKCDGRKVEKDRYKINIGGYSAEVDVFNGELAGLVVIDFEFSDEDSKNSFVAPAVCLADITQAEWIAGGILAGKSYKDIANNLATTGYIALFQK